MSSNFAFCQSTQTKLALLYTVGLRIIFNLQIFMSLLTLSFERPLAAPGYNYPVPDNPLVYPRPIRRKTTTTTVRPEKADIKDQPPFLEQEQKQEEEGYNYPIPENPLTLPPRRKTTTTTVASTTVTIPGTTPKLVDIKLCKTFKENEQGKFYLVTYSEVI